MPPEYVGMEHERGSCIFEDTSRGGERRHALAVWLREFVGAHDGEIVVGYTHAADPNPPSPFHGVVSEPSLIGILRSGMSTSSAVTSWLPTTSDMVDTDANLANTRRRAPTPSARRGGVRIIVGYTTIACALPYFVLKLIWLSGSALGVSDLTMLHDAGMIALNTITAGMDLVAILIALAFTHQWGLRVPAWLLLPPMWVASGLLARFVVAVPITTIAAALTSSSPPGVPAGPVQPWVYALVYTEFAGLGIGLVLAFVLYARARWAFVFQSTTRTAPPGTTHDIQLPLATLAALIAMVAGALNIAWAFGSSIGVGAEVAARRTFSSHLINAIDGALMIAAAAGVLLLVYRIGRGRPLWLALTLAWVGGGSLFGWGLWHMIVVLPHTALARSRPQDMAVFDLLALLQLLSGLVIGVVMFFLLAEKVAYARIRALESIKT